MLFDCAARGALTFQDRTGLTMLTAITAIIIVLSIGILIAHALDAHSNLEIIIVTSPGSFFLFGLCCY